MTLSHRQRVKRDLVGLINGELSTQLKSAPLVFAQPLTRRAVADFSRSLAEQFLGNEAFLEKVAELAPRKNAEWLTTEEAAKKSGFSRPFIVALLDGPLFKGSVAKTDKGHRRVAAIDFQLWMDRHKRTTDTSLELSDLRSGPRSDRPARLVESTDDREQRVSDRREALKLARKLGLE